MQCDLDVGLFLSLVNGLALALTAGIFVLGAAS